MTPRSIRQAFGPYAKLHIPKEPPHWAVTLLAISVGGALTGLLIVLPALYL